MSAEVQIRRIRGFHGAYTSNTLETFISSSKIGMTMPLNKYN